MSQYLHSVIPGKDFGDGKDGALTVSSNSTFTTSPSVAFAGCSGTSGTTSLTVDSASTFANGDVIYIEQSAGTSVGNWEINYIVSGGGGTTLTLLNNLSFTYTDSGSSQAQVMTVKRYTNVTINGGVSLSAPVWDANKGGLIVLAASGVTTITGNIVGTAFGFGTQGVSGANPDNAPYNGVGYSGDTYSGRGTPSTSANNGGGGGGGANLTNDSAGGGGFATAGQNGQGAGTHHGTGGGTYGQANLQLIYFGSAGGDSHGDSAIAVGGLGGAKLILFTKDIVVTGTIINSGGTGEKKTSTSSGAGSGGSTLIKCQTANLGSSLVTAVGGTAVAATNTGGNGGNGRIHVDYRFAITGTTNPAADTTQDGNLSGDAFFGGIL